MCEWFREMIRQTTIRDIVKIEAKTLNSEYYRLLLRRVLKFLKPSNFTIVC